jgi:hypothetical protein
MRTRWLPLGVLLLVSLAGCAADQDPDWDVDDVDDAFVSGKDDGEARYRPAWDQPRTLVVGGSLVGQEVRYQPYETTTTETVVNGMVTIDVNHFRPDDAWTEVGRYRIELACPGRVAIEVGNGDAQSDLATVIAVRPVGGGASSTISQQGRRLELDLAAGEHRIVVMPMVFPIGRDVFRYDIAAAAR